jgi:hypothetical protein
MLVGYMRVFTDGGRQVLDLQRDTIRSAGGRRAPSVRGPQAGESYTRSVGRTLKETTQSRFRKSRFNIKAVRTDGR